MAAIVSACIVHSHDREVSQRITGLLHGHARVYPSQDANELFALAVRHGPVVIFLDALNGDLFEVADTLAKSFDECPIIVLGEDVSEPILALDQRLVFAVVSLQSGNRAILRQFSVSQHQLDMLESCRLESAEATYRLELQTKSMPRPGQFIRGLLWAFATFRSREELFEQFADWIEQHYDVSRAGFYWRDTDADRGFVATLAGRGSEPSPYAVDHPFVRHLEANRRVVHASALQRLRGPARLLCDEALNEMEGQAIFPMMTGTSGLDGWLFVGGCALEELGLEDLKELKTLTSCLTAMLEREEASEPPAEPLTHPLESLPVALLTLDEELSVTWANQPALGLLGKHLDDSKRLMESVPGLGKVIQLALRGNGATSRLWVPIHDCREYAVATIDLQNSTNHRFLAILREENPEVMLGSRELEIEEADGALRSSLCTKIRDPLVAIKAFIELFPERGQDASFCDEFVPLISGSVERLENLTATLEREGAGASQSVAVEYALRHLLEDVFVEIGESLQSHHFKNTRDVFLNWPLGRRRVFIEHLAHLASVDAWAESATFEWVDLEELGEVRLTVGRSRDSVASGVPSSQTAVDGLEQFLHRHRGSIDLSRGGHHYRLNITVPKIIL